MTDRAREKAERQLAPGEKLLWWGQPQGAVRTLAAKGGSFGFMIVWTLFAIAWTGGAWLMSRFAAGEGGVDPMFTYFPLFGVPFILIGLGGLYANIRGAAVAVGTTYGLTDHRVIVIAGDKVTSYGAADFSYVQREGTDKRGTISFAHTSIESGARPTAQLLNIDEPAKVEAMIRSQFLMRK